MFFIFIIFSLVSNPIDEITSILKDIKPYYSNLTLPKSIETDFKENQNQFFTITSQFLDKYPLNPTNYRIIFLRGYLYHQKKDFQNSIIEFKKILGVYTELQDYILFYLGEGYESTGEILKAYQAYALITESSNFFGRAIKRKIDILFSLKRFEEIRIFFNRESQLLEDLSFSMIYAKTLIELKQEDEAILQLKKIWFQSQNEVKLEVEGILKKFEQNGKQIAKISALESYNRCEYLLQKGDYFTIKNSFKVSQIVSNITSARTDICILKAFLYTGDLSKSYQIDKLKKIKEKKNKVISYYILYLDSLKYFYEKKYDEAEKKFLQLIEEYKLYPDNERIYEYLIDLYDKKGEFEKKYTILDQYLKESYFSKRGYYLNNAYWYHYKNKKYKKAISFIDEYLKLSDESDDLRDGMRARYYRIKSNFFLKNYQLVVEETIELISEDPLNYYSYLSYLILKDNPKEFSKELLLKSIKAVNKTRKSADLTLFYGNSKILKIYELIKLQLFDLGKAETFNFLKVAKTDIEYLSSALFFEELNLYRSSRNVYFRELRKLSFFKSYKDFITFWQSFYPKKYNNDVTNASKKYNVPTSFIWGIMREESAYNPFAKSVSDAYGLMQLLYSTAQETADRINMRLGSYNDLYKPEINIPLGTKYLSVLLNMFSNNFYYTAASYNGGATNVKRWISSAPENQDIYDFSEDIPFEETNRYIYKVIGSYHTYQLLYENSFKLYGVDIIKEFFE
ncbi:lytic transglycosylase domain-containing protein [bacterium]|nr:lytic transglycosylase domain-containing protein [bacterium]